jgi:hypothetical protein
MIKDDMEKFEIRLLMLERIVAQLASAVRDLEMIEARRPGGGTKVDLDPQFELGIG